MEQEKVVLEQVADSARRIVIRLDVGSFTVSGPGANMLTVESLVAFSTTVNELCKEGYRMVPPEEYAGVYGASVESVYRKIHEQGDLFLLLYDGAGARSEAVSLEEKSVSEELGPQLV